MKKNVKKESAEFDYKTIKSFEDACKKEKMKSELPDLSVIPEEFRKPTMAAYKLFVIFKAINNGWEPNWNDSDQYKYNPWFRIDADDARPSGFGFSGSHYDDWLTSAHVGSRLCCENREKALYIAQQFEQEYLDLFLKIQ